MNPLQTGMPAGVDGGSVGCGSVACGSVGGGAVGGSGVGGSDVSVSRGLTVGGTAVSCGGSGVLVGIKGVALGGTGVWLEVGGRVGLAVGVLILVGVRVGGTGVLVGGEVNVGLGVGVRVGIIVGVRLGTKVDVRVGMRVGVCEGLVRRSEVMLTNAVRILEGVAVIAEMGVRVAVGESAAAAGAVALAVAVEGSEVLNGDLTTFKTESAKSPEVLTPRTRISCQSFHEKMSTGLKTVIKNTIIVREMRRFFFIGTPSSFHPYTQCDFLI